MKKLLFHLMNTLICALFMNVRLAFFLFGDASSLNSGVLTFVNILTAVFGTYMLVSIYFSFREAFKKDK